jgi:murein DD-endopeptidase MepM/ murein hydrolase activator NlpD
VFPVAGPFTYGEGIGADRGDHRHEGQDLAAPAGTPVVAPLAGTVASVAYQRDGAGYYVVLNGTDGRSFFFAHCQKGSFGVSGGQVVTAGTQLCRVGSTGASSGPHLHFEIWVNGWRVSKKSAPIDPLPQLRAWAS